MQKIGCALAAGPCAIIGPPRVAVNEKGPAPPLQTLPGRSLSPAMPAIAASSYLLGGHHLTTPAARTAAVADEAARHGHHIADPSGTSLLRPVATRITVALPSRSHVRNREAPLMDTDRNLLFAVLALQVDLLDRDRFVQACTLWAGHKDRPIADLLIEQGWLTPDDRADVQRLLARKLKKHRGDVQASLATVGNDVLHSLLAVGDPDVQRSVAGIVSSEPTTVAATVDYRPVVCDRYARTSLHAVGGIGRVWLAHDRDLRRDVALKEIRPERIGDPGLQARFLQEARITGQLEHPGVVPVYELIRKPGGQPFYTMRFVKGRTLNEVAKDWHEARRSGRSDSLAMLNLLNAFAAVCNTVAYAHSRGVIHRDLKGQNIVLGDFGEVVVLDWGLAKLVAVSDEEGTGGAVRADPKDNGASDLTVAGQTVGTPAYMAPEQAAGRPDMIDRRTDIYGLGAVLYEILTGRAPFSGPDTATILRKVQEDEPAPVHQLWPEVPPALESLCLGALAKRPTDRPADAIDLARQVQQWLAESAERKQADQQRARFFALSVDLMCIAGFDGYFKQLNPAWEKTIGWTIAELLARPWNDFLHLDDVARTIAAVQHIRAGDALLSHENRYRCKDGSYRWLHWTAQEISGEQLIYGVARDITDRKRAEAALHESEDRYRSVIAAMQDGIAILDADGTIRDCNAAAERILGLSAEQIMGRTPHDPRWRAIHEDGSPFPGETHPPMVTLRTGQPCSDVIMGIHKPDGTLTWITVNSQPLFLADGRTLAGAVASFEDITERERAKEFLHRKG
jgi:PAS domain S-box-containing protein